MSSALFQDDSTPPKRRPEPDSDDKGDENARARKALLADESTSDSGDVSGLEGTHFFFCILMHFNVGDLFFMTVDSADLILDE